MKMTGTLRRVLSALLVLLVVSSTAASAGIILLVRIGTDSEGNPLFREANSSDTYLAGLSNLISTSSSIQEASRYYDAVQQDKLAQAYSASGVSGSQLAQAISATGTQPTFIEAQPGNGGSYNDWQGKFSVQMPNGQVQSFTQPRVVFPLNNQVMQSGDTGLITQTLIHEMGHGSMCQCFMCRALRALPNSANLGKPHSGGSVTDPNLAFIEGWAEFVGTYFTGRTTIAQDPDGAMTSNWYATDGQGHWKNAQQLLSCEGWAASLMYKISTDAANDNAMWKMTQVMSRTSPQNLTDLLGSLAVSCPELAPIIDQDVNQMSGGQIPNLASMEQMAGSQPIAAAPVSTTTLAATPNSAGIPSAYGSPTTVAAQQYYASGAATTQPYYAGGTAVAPQYAGAAAATSSDASGGTASAGQGASSQDVATLQARYAQDKAQLDALPWWNFWTRWSLNSDLSSIQKLYQQALTPGAGGATVAAAPDSTGTSTASTYEGPAAPTSSAAGAPADLHSYTSVMDALRSGDDQAVRQALAQHRVEQDRRNALRQQDPQPER